MKPKLQHRFGTFKIFRVQGRPTCQPRASLVEAARGVRRFDWSNLPLPRLHPWPLQRSTLSPSSFQSSHLDSGS